jgi:hypothetical protein
MGFADELAELQAAKKDAKTQRNSEEYCVVIVFIVAIRE